MQAQLNTDQRACFQTIVAAITDNPQIAYFYLQGPGGTSKTFLYKTLYYYYYSQGKTVLYIALIGIAALLLLNGHISHSQFQIPLELNKLFVSIITKTSRLGAYLQSIDLIIWDEVLMQYKYYFKVIYRLIVNLQSAIDNIPSSRGPVILGSDFAQILPVILYSSRADIIRVM